ncbi:unnamed protein product [Bursaphelenchus xylophilus]|uniref:(pine wood nematode) hypothetical protein n=1 Tax=Bursaphelenchus xylophilus TaxID=6326 RepID=A0A1I7SVQ9_BURXY|nr:unnamed protein product [Bursaphelenchus xylophilus]CAG9098108.1 unnamed protein product [Bursaphelenchus xylophilus]
MDVSFEPTMAGGGWGTDVGNVSMTQAPAASSGQFEKIPLPISLKEAATCRSEDDKFHIASFGFVNVKVIGRVETIEDSPTGERNLTLINAKEADSVSLKVILYETVQNKTDAYAEGDIVLILGKIRNFDGEVSMLAFHLQVITDPKKVECFLLEVALANRYYSNNFPERVSNEIAIELNGTVFSNAPPEVRNKPGQGQNNQSGFGGMGGPAATATTPNARGLSGVQAKIHNVIQQKGGESGIHVDEIKRSIGNVAKFDEELQHLVNEGMIYSTIDDYHYSAL